MTFTTTSECCLNHNHIAFRKKKSFVLMLDVTLLSLFPLTPLNRNALTSPSTPSFFSSISHKCQPVLNQKFRRVFTISLVPFSLHTFCLVNILFTHVKYTKYISRVSFQKDVTTFTTPNVILVVLAHLMINRLQKHFRMIIIISTISLLRENR